MVTMAGPEEEYQEYQDLLEEHCYIITEMLDPIKVVPYLRSKHVMDENDYEEIEAKDTRKKKAMHFVNLLKGKGPEGYGHFIDILEKVMPHLYRLLTNKDPRRQSALSTYGQEEGDFCPDCLGAGSSEYLLLATKLVELNKKYAAVKWREATKSNAVEEFQEKFRAKEVEVEDLQRKMENYEDIKRGYLQLKDQNHSLTEEKSNLLAKVVSYMEESKSTQERLRETMQELDQVHLELNNEREKMTLERTQSIRLRREVESQPSSIKLQRKVELLEMELAKERSKNRAAVNPAVTDSSTDILKQDLEEAQEKCKDMVEDLYRVREELHKAEQQKEKIRQEKEELQVQCSLLSSEKNNHKKWSETALDKLQQVEKERNEAWQARDDAQTNMRKCIADKDKYWAMVNDLTNQIEEKDKEIGQLRMKMTRNKIHNSAQHDSILLAPPRGVLCDSCGQALPIYGRQTSSISNRSSDDIDVLVKEKFRKRAYETKYYNKFCRSHSLGNLTQEAVDSAFDEIPKTYISDDDVWDDVPYGTLQRTETTTPEPSYSVRSRNQSDSARLKYSQIGTGSLSLDETSRRTKCNSIADAECEGSGTAHDVRWARILSDSFTVSGVPRDEICDPFCDDRPRSQSLGVLEDYRLGDGSLKDGSDSGVEGAESCRVFSSSPRPGSTALTKWEVTLPASDLQVEVTIVGGNKEGIFVESCREGSEAARLGLVQGQQITDLEYRAPDQYGSGRTIRKVPMAGLTLEEAFQAVGDACGQVTLTGMDNWSGYQFSHEHIRVLRGGDDFYVRSNSNVEDLDCKVKEGEIFHVTCSRYKGDQKWYATQVDPDTGNFSNPGPIPSSKRLIKSELQSSLAKSAQKKPSLMPFLPSPTRSRSMKPPLSPKEKVFMRSQSEQPGFFGADELSFTPYTRVKRVDVKGKRPVLLLGPQMLVHNVAFQLTLPPHQEEDLQFQLCPPVDTNSVATTETASKETGTGQSTQHMVQSGEMLGGLVSQYSLKSIKDIISQEKHCVLTLSTDCLQCLHDNNIHPIIIFLKPGRSKNLMTLTQGTDKQVAKDQKTQAMDVFNSLSQLVVEHFCIELDGAKVKDKEGIVLAVKEQVRKVQGVKILWLEEARPV
ncbi:caspase recruitment domain-containing protein 11-like isoform X3 [Branchiostoma lanceolatum]|uniref:caspase recruitment domain-containing protein 11-like isoform X3 n=1 Tax=Branchiostoma lanceolatum TaxID=7740 RepID=UPI003454C732